MFDQTKCIISYKPINLILLPGGTVEAQYFLPGATVQTKGPPRNLYADTHKTVWPWSGYKGLFMKAAAGVTSGEYLIENVGSCGNCDGHAEALWMDLPATFGGSITFRNCLFNRRNADGVTAAYSILLNSGSARQITFDGCTIIGQLQLNGMPGCSIKSLTFRDMPKPPIVYTKKQATSPATLEAFIPGGIHVVTSAPPAPPAPADTHTLPDLRGASLHRASANIELVSPDQIPAAELAKHAKWQLIGPKGAAADTYNLYQK